MQDIDSMNERELVEEIKILEALLAILESSKMLIVDTMDTMPVPMLFSRSAVGEEGAKFARAYTN